jgi:quinol monooxygenase YgiN
VARTLLTGKPELRPGHIELTAGPEPGGGPMASPVRVAMRWKVPVGQTRAITEALQSVMFATRLERGCAACSVATEAGERVTVLYQEDWDSEEDLRRQVRSPRFVRLAGLVESALEPPEIEFRLPTGTRGLDYAEEIRGETNAH